MTRTYPTNSPEAAGRVLAMAVLSDGHCSAVELETLRHMKAAERVGLSPAALHHIINGLAQDMQTATLGDMPTFDRLAPPTRDALLNGITDPYLQMDLQAMAHEVVVADGHLADGKAALVNTLGDRWHSHHIHIGSGDGTA